MWPFSMKRKTPPDAQAFRTYDQLDLVAFREHPVWLYVHIHDFGNPIYEECDEETMRPWPGDYPAPADAVCEVAASFVFADGREVAGCITLMNGGESAVRPVVDHSPRLFLPSGRTVSFWHGGVYQFGDEFLREAMNLFYAEFQVTPATAFPITYSVPPNVIAGGMRGTIPGFGYFASEDAIVYVTSPPVPSKS